MTRCPHWDRVRGDRLATGAGSGVFTAGLPQLTGRWPAGCTVGGESDPTGGRGTAGGADVDQSSSQVDGARASAPDPKGTTVPERSPDPGAAAPSSSGPLLPRATSRTHDGRPARTNRRRTDRSFSDGRHSSCDHIENTPNTSSRRAVNGRPHASAACAILFGVPVHDVADQVQRDSSQRSTRLICPE